MSDAIWKLVVYNEHKVKARVEIVPTDKVYKYGHWILNSYLRFLLTLDVLIDLFFM